MSSSVCVADSNMCQAMWAGLAGCFYVFHYRACQVSDSQRAADGLQSAVKTSWTHVRLVLCQPQNPDVGNTVPPVMKPEPHPVSGFTLLPLPYSLSWLWIMSDGDLQIHLSTDRVIWLDESCSMTRATFTCMYDSASQSKITDTVLKTLTQREGKKPGYFNANLQVEEQKLSQHHNNTGF